MYCTARHPRIGGRHRRAVLVLRAARRVDRRRVAVTRPLCGVPRTLTQHSGRGRSAISVVAQSDLRLKGIHARFSTERLHGMRRQCFLHVFGIAGLLLSGCHRVATPTCFPGRGSEVWVERHLPALGPTNVGARLELRLLPDTSSARVASDQDQVVSLVSPAHSSQGSTRHDISTNRSASIELRPGAYNVRLSGITFIPTTRTVVITESDSVIVEAQLRRAPYCLEPVVSMGG